jgi:hypothetical protein
MHALLKLLPGFFSRAKEVLGPSAGEGQSVCAALCRAYIALR